MMDKKMVNLTVPVIVEDIIVPNTHAILYAREGELPSAYYCRDEDEADRIIRDFERNGTFMIPNGIIRSMTIVEPAYVIKAELGRALHKIFQSVTMENKNAIDQQELPSEDK